MAVLVGNRIAAQVGEWVDGFLRLKLLDQGLGEVGLRGPVWAFADIGTAFGNAPAACAIW